ncbi:MAG TPA: helix-turn-helix transcriptional regulator [Streptosporangiaceae bacterium]|jgi:transcriptional regulator with XRE-family HTH domain|nr:helix-turn-helix transcriptional regulator [Streptosporangiaceae bacterium]
MARRGNQDQNPTLRGRRLALELMRRRETSGLSREEVARRLEWSTSTIFRIETGRSRPQPGNVRVLLDLYGVTGTERDGLIQLARDARKPGWWHSFRDVLPNPYEVYIGLEAGAASIRNFEPIVVPGLLQTEDYARNALRSGPRELDQEEVERRLEVRMERQRILARADRPRLWAVLDEAVIRRVVGGPEIMREQLRHLAASAQQGKTTIQVVPFSAGAHAGTTGPFVILGFPEQVYQDVVYVETLAGDIYLEERPDVTRYTIAFDRLLAAALPPDESVRLIEQTAEALS